MHELSQKSSSNVSVQQIRAQLEPDQSVTFKKRLPCSDIIEKRKALYEGSGVRRDENDSQLKQKPVVPQKPLKSLSAMLSPVSPLSTVSPLSPLTTIPSLSLVSATNEDSNEEKDHKTERDSTIRRASTIASDQSGAPGHSTKVRCAAAYYDGLIKSGQLTSPTVFVRSPNSSSFDSSFRFRKSSQRSSIMSDSSWTDLHVASPLSTDSESSSSGQWSRSDKRTEDLNEKTLITDGTVGSDENTIISLRKTSLLGEKGLHATVIEELKKNDVFKGTNEQALNEAENGASSLKLEKLRTKSKSGRQTRGVNSEPLLVVASPVESLRPNSDAYGRSNSLCRDRASSMGTSSFDCSLSDIVYSTGFPDEDVRLKKLHYAALEIYTVEKKFVEQLELIAVKYPEFIAKYGKEYGIDFLKQLSEGNPPVIKQISVQLLMVEGAHKCLLEKISSKIVNWDSRDPDMAECLKSGAGYLKYCLPYLKEKKKHVDDFLRLLQDNEELARATAKFEEQVMGKISVIQQLDIVHQNVVRYTILLEAYKKYLLPESKELEVCKEALVELSKVSESVDRQISLAEMETRLIDLYRRLEGKFNVFEANRHLLFEGELLKQSRRDVQPRYLILFSDILLICKYSRTPSLGADTTFHSDYYKFHVSRIRVRAEEHGEYETHFQLYTTQKSAVFIAKTKRERDEWVKRISEAKMEAKELRRNKAFRHKSLNICMPQQEAPPAEITSDAKTAVNGSSDHDMSPTYVPANEKYTALWIPDPKATSCMMAGCATKFGLVNRRHHCRECGWLICRSCVGYAPVKNESQYVREKVCPECYIKIAKKWRGELPAGVFTAPKKELLTKTNVPSRNADGVVTGTVFLRNRKGGESEKWGRLIRHADGVLVLCFYDAEFDANPLARHVLLGFTLCMQELDDGGRLFELRHANQVGARNAFSIRFRVAHSGNAERWYNALKGGLENGSTSQNTS